MPHQFDCFIAAILLEELHFYRLSFIKDQLGACDSGSKHMVSASVTVQRKDDTAAFTTEEWLETWANLTDALQIYMCFILNIVNNLKLQFNKLMLAHLLICLAFTQPVS